VLWVWDRWRIQHRDLDWRLLSKGTDLKKTTCRRVWKRCVVPPHPRVRCNTDTGRLLMQPRKLDARGISDRTSHTIMIPQYLSDQLPDLQDALLHDNSRDERKHSIWTATRFWFLR